MSICMNVSKTENSANQLKALTEVEARTCKMTKGVIGNPKNRNQTCICMFLWAERLSYEQKTKGLGALERLRQARSTLNMLVIFYWNFL